VFLASPRNISTVQSCVLKRASICLFSILQLGWTASVLQIPSWDLSQALHDALWIGSGNCHRYQNLRMFKTFM
jgi:hypothetical protein